MKKRQVEVKKKTKIKAKAKPALKKKRPLKRKEESPAQEYFGLHRLVPPVGAHKRKRILGRGSSSGHGKTSTRGSKGQTSRAGRDFYLGFEGGQTPLIRRIPKRGFTSRFRKEFQIVNLKDLSKIKETLINPQLLEDKGLIGNKDNLVKILGEGEIKSAVTVQAHAFSRKALQAIKDAGGKTEIINA